MADAETPGAEDRDEGPSSSSGHSQINLLSAIVGYLDLALEDIADDHPARTMVAKAQDAARKVIDMKTGSEAKAEEAAPSGANILVVDDEPMMRDVLSHVLTRAGYRVVTAENGREAVECVRDSVPDLVITDIVMPEQEGIQTIVELRRIAPGIGIIAVSGGGRDVNGASDNYLAAAKKLGADHVFEKPVNHQALLKAVGDMTA